MKELTTLYIILALLLAFHLLVGRDAYGNRPFNVKKKYNWLLKVAYVSLGVFAYIANSIYMMMFIISEINTGRKDGFVHNQLYDSLLTEILYTILCGSLLWYGFAITSLIIIRHSL